MVCTFFDKNSTSLADKSASAGAYKEAVVRRCFSKKVFIKISQYSREDICVGVSF